MYEQDFIRFLLAVICITSSTAGKEVLELTDTNFYTKISLPDYALVLFYAPWCKRSKKLMPELDKAAKELENKPPLALFKVDCTESSDEICKEYAKDESYPKLKIFQDGQFFSDYHDTHIKWFDIVKYMRGQLKSASIELSSNKEIKHFVNTTEETAVIGFFQNSSPNFAPYKEVGQKLKPKVNFAHILLQEPANEKIVLYLPLYLENKFEEQNLTYKGDFTRNDIHNFIVTNMHGLVGVRKIDNQREFSKPLIITYFNIDYKLNPKNANYWRNRVLLVAKEFKNIVTFAVSSRDDFIEELESVGINFNSEKPVVLAKRYGGKRYVMTDDFSVDNLRKFVNDFLDNKVEPFVKSEPIPASQSGPVIKAVAKTFEKLVEKNDKDTLVKFHALWCSHCQSLAPIYQEVAEKLQDEDVDVIEIDAEANEIPSAYSISGYPTVYFMKKNKKSEHVKFEEERTVEEFIKFIAKEASQELKGWDRDGVAKERKVEL